MGSPRWSKSRGGSCRSRASLSLALATLGCLVAGAPASAAAPAMRPCAIAKEFRPGTFAFSLSATGNVECSTASAVMEYWSRHDLGRGDTFSLGGRRWRLASWTYNRPPSRATRQTLTFTSADVRRVAFVTQPTN
jgi:hypothetical protein